MSAHRGDHSLLEMAESSPTAWREHRKDLIGLFGMDHVAGVDSKVREAECERAKTAGLPRVPSKIFDESGLPLPLWDDVKRVLEFEFNTYLAGEIELLVRRGALRKQFIEVVQAEAALDPEGKAILHTPRIVRH